MRRSRDVKDAATRGAAEEVAKSLVAQRRHDHRSQAGAEGKLFGSVTTAESPRPSPPRPASSSTAGSSHLDEPIKTLGTHTVPAKLHADVEFPITVEVVAS